MSESARLRSFLDGARVDGAVFGLRPDYRALLVAVDGLIPSSGDRASEELLLRAEAVARDLLSQQPVDLVPHVDAWRSAYRAFGVKPQRMRNSLEALLRRAVSDGLPRVNRPTDVYNAVSVLHLVPVGGEDLPSYSGPPRLVRASGAEIFDTVLGGAAVTEHPEIGEVVWCDEVGVTCRRWNWRQGRRTRLRDDTTSALFIFDALDPMTDEAVHAAGQDLTDHLAASSPGLVADSRLIAPGTRID
jgi:DNA/RNA-binding domain of Phe-tRNA-synthetase-like protein